MARRNIKIPEPLFDRLNDDRQRRGLTWPQYLRVLHQKAGDGDVANRIDALEDRVARVEERLDQMPDRVADQVASELRR